MSKPTLYGAAYSCDVRIARLALEEKGVVYDLSPVDIFAQGGPPAWYLDHHPFGRIPAFEHDGFRLFETSAIARYVDEAFDGPALQPANLRARAVMNQIIGLLDAYAYRAMVWDIYVETVSKPAEGGSIDQARVAVGRRIAETCLTTLSRLKADGPFLLGGQLTLADLHAAPIFGYFMKAPLAAAMLSAHPKLQDWWERCSARPHYVSVTGND